MELINIPEELQNQAFLYYGISNYPPPNDSATWKLLFNAKTVNNSCMITNGDNAGIYMICDSPDYDMIKCNKSHFENPLLQIIFMNINENFIFGQIGKYIYKLIPNDLLQDDDTKVDSFSARIILGEDKQQEFTERVKWYQEQIDKLAGATNISYVGMVQLYKNTGSELNYQFQVGKKRYFLGKTLTDWISVEDKITDLYPNWIYVLSQKSFIKHHGIVVMNPLGQITSEVYNRQIEKNSIDDPQATIMTRYNKRYIIHCEVYDGREYFLVSAISDIPFSINIKDILEVPNIVSINYPYGITLKQAGNIDLNQYYNADTGILKAWLARCCYDDIAMQEKEYFYVGTFANVQKETNILRSIPNTANIEAVATQATKINNFKNLLTAGNNANWGLITMDAMLASVVIPMRILYNGLSIDKMPNYVANVNNEFSNSLGGIGVGSYNNQTKNNFINTSSFILGQAHAQGINFIVDNTANTTNIKCFMFNNAFFNTIADWRTSSRMFLRNDPNLLPMTILNFEPTQVNISVDNKQEIIVTTSALDFEVEIDNNEIASIEKQDKKIIVTGLKSGSTFVTVTAHATNSKLNTKNISVFVN